MLEQRWDSIVSSRFDVLRRDLKMMATVNGVVNEALLAEVGLALPRSDFDGLVKGKTSPSLLTGKLIAPAKT